MSKKAKQSQLQEFASHFDPIEGKDSLLLLTDKCTGAKYCECHIKGNLLVEFGNVHAPLDPETQAEYKANRDIETNHPAFDQMKKDALRGRSFSDIVAEYDKTRDPDHPLKIVGGQHRFEAIKLALAKRVDEVHGVKVYFDLDKKQRMDVQAISNTNIAVSKALLDRMRETARGGSLRSWCQDVGLLAAGEDFSAKPGRRKIYVRLARTFITNYMKGKDVKEFSKTATTPVICPSGANDADWVALVEKNPGLWKDEKLLEAGREFAKLVVAQREAYKGKKAKPDLPDKALNIAVVAGWAYAAGALWNNVPRLSRHFGLSKTTKLDPLHAEKLAKARFKFDPPNYRGLGNRTDAKEAGRLAELFWMHAEKGEGITLPMMTKAITKYEVKILSLETPDA